jgi:uncharacterized protein with PQ loop repeat
VELILGFLENGIASVATFFLIIAYIPQVITTYRTKVVDGIDPNFWRLITIALGLLFINSIYIFIKFGTWGYMFMEAFNFGLAFAMFVMVEKYRKK